LEPIISTNNLNKRFKLYLKKPSSIQFIKSLIRNNNKIYVWKKAVNDLSININKGDKVALIGNNGAGKTTILKIFAGLIKPSSGTITIRGEVIYLAGLGVGMQNELTVRENIFLYSKIYGLDNKYIDSKVNDILNWADLEEYSHAAFRTLSTGMRSRLAFSVIRYIDTDIYLMDEALTAGDKTFRQKCVDYLNQNIKADNTYIISTHNFIYFKH